MADQQQFCLRWNNHGSTLVAVFDNLLANESLVDVTLFAEGQLLKAHKVVLSACSTYFQTLFAQTTDKHPIVILKDVKYVELKALLEYMYRGEVNIAQDELGPLIQTADSLKIKGLAEGCGGARTGTETDARSSHPAGLIDLAKSEEEESSPSDEKSSSKPSLKSGVRQGRIGDFPAPPQVSVPSVLSAVLTMPPALSLASSTLVPPIKLPSTLNPSVAGTTTDGSSPEDSDSPHIKRRKRMRRKSGETGGESGDSDGRCSSGGSQGDPQTHHHQMQQLLPRIPATITPIGGGGSHPHHHPHQQQQQHHHQQQQNFHHQRDHHRDQHQQLQKEQQQQREREMDRDREQQREWERERDQENEREHRDREREIQEQQQHLRSNNDSPSSPENLVGSSSKGSAQAEVSGGTTSPGVAGSRPSHMYEQRPLSPTKALALLVRPADDNSSDANHMSEDEYDYKGSIERLAHDHPQDTPGPSTSRPRTDDAQQPPNYLGWPYPPETSGHSEDSAYSALENTNQDYLRAYNLMRAGFPGLLPPRISASDFLARTPPPIGLPLLLKREKPSPKSILGGYPFSESPKQFACEKCGRTYASTGNLKRHKKYECGVEPQFSCPICKKKFQHRHSVKIHVFSTHRSEAGEGGAPDSKPEAPGGVLFPTSEGMAAAVGPVACKEEFFPIPQEANAPTSQNQDA